MLRLISILLLLAASAWPPGAGAVAEAVVRCSVVDALGAPIPRAVLEFDLLNEGFSARVEADERGAAELTWAEADLGSVALTVSHAAYGRAIGDYDQAGRFVVPLVAADSEAGHRAARGAVVDPDGHPVAGVRISCLQIRSPGEGLMQGSADAVAVSDDDGRFAFYLPLDTQRADHRGELVPPNSTYHLAFEPPEGSGLFPTFAKVSNAESAEVVMPRPTRFHRFRVEVEPGVLADAADVRNVWFYWIDGGTGAGVTVPEAVQREGGMIPEGRYLCRRSDQEYEPVTVGADSPEWLEFRLRLGRTIRGRAIDGTTGEPINDAVVFFWSGTSSETRLAEVFDEPFWDRVEHLERGRAVSGEGVKALMPGDGFTDVLLARVAADGTYILQEPAGEPKWGLMVSAPGRLPFYFQLSHFAKGDGLEFEMADAPLFPGAVVTVRPELRDDQGRVSVGYRWQVAEDEDPPPWIERFRATHDGSWSGVYRSSWLNNNEAGPLLVPAGVAFTLHLPTPYDDQVAQREAIGPLKLRAGQTHDAGTVTFIDCPLLRCRVVGPDGEPIEGAPVRMSSPTRRSWSVPHNTDARGEAQFHVDPRVGARFSISGGGVSIATDDQPVIEPFEDPEKVEVPTLTLTADQLRQLRGEK